MKDLAELNAIYAEVELRSANRIAAMSLGIFANVRDREKYEERLEKIVDSECAEINDFVKSKTLGRRK